MRRNFRRMAPIAGRLRIPGLRIRLEVRWSTVAAGRFANGFRVVGKPAPNGVLVHVSSRPGSECRGEVDGNDRLQALWVFSSDACGIYDIPGVTLICAGRVNPVGQITL